MDIKIKTRKVTRSFYIPITILDEVEEITRPAKGMNVNKAVNEGLVLWLKKQKED